MPHVIYKFHGGIAGIMFMGICWVLLVHHKGFTCQHVFYIYTIKMFQIIFSLCKAFYIIQNTILM